MSFALTKDSHRSPHAICYARIQYQARLLQLRHRILSDGPSYFASLTPWWVSTVPGTCPKYSTFVYSPTQTSTCPPSFNNYPGAGLPHVGSSSCPTILHLSAASERCMVHSLAGLSGASLVDRTVTWCFRHAFHVTHVVLTE